MSLAGGNCQKLASRSTVWIKRIRQVGMAQDRARGLADNSGSFAAPPGMQLFWRLCDPCAPRSIRTPVPAARASLRLAAAYCAGYRPARLPAHWNTSREGQTGPEALQTEKKLPACQSDQI